MKHDASVYMYLVNNIKALPLHDYVTQTFEHEFYTKQSSSYIPVAVPSSVDREMVIS